MDGGGGGRGGGGLYIHTKMHAIKFYPLDYSWFMPEMCK